MHPVRRKNFSASSTPKKKKKTPDESGRTPSKFYRVLFSPTRERTPLGPDSGQWKISILISPRKNLDFRPIACLSFCLEAFWVRWTVRWPWKMSSTCVFFPDFYYSTMTNSKVWTNSCSSSPSFTIFFFFSREISFHFSYCYLSLIVGSSLFLVNSSTLKTLKGWPSFLVASLRDSSRWLKFKNRNVHATNPSELFFLFVDGGWPLFLGHGGPLVFRRDPRRWTCISNRFVSPFVRPPAEFPSVDVIVEIYWPRVIVIFWTWLENGILTEEFFGYNTALTIRAFKLRYRVCRCLSSK